MDRFKSYHDLRFVSAGAASFTDSRPPPQFMDCHFYSRYLLVPLSVVLHVASVIAIDLGTKQSVYHLHTWETCSQASDARSTSLEHVRARLGWIAAGLEVGLVFSIICILKASVVVILLHLMRTVNDDPSNWLMPELLASS